MHYDPQTAAIIIGLIFASPVFMSLFLNMFEGLVIRSRR